MTLRGLLSLLVALCVAACGTEPVAKNLLLISVDTLRNDRLDHPSFAALEAEGVVFTNAYSQSGWTLPSMATILTGHYPKDHGATDFYSGVDAGLPTLASILVASGFDTRAFVSHLLLTPRYGLDKGFAQYDTSVLERSNPHEASTGEQITELTLNGMRVAREPFFIWAHYFDPHFEYLSHHRWSEFGDLPIGRYDQEVAFTDRQIGRLLEHLRQTGLMERTLVVFTSDHGEEFEEHGGGYHYTLYDEVVRVPLVMQAPGLSPGVREVPAQQVDLLPTFLDLLGVERPAGLPGVNLFDAVEADRPVFIARDRPSGFKQRAIVRGDKKLIRIEEVEPSTPPEVGRSNYMPVQPGIYLFDRRRDAAEKQNLFDAEDASALALLAELAAHAEEAGATPGDVELDEKTREELRALGYLK